MSEPLRLTDQKRAAILAAAIAEFRANGFQSTSMDKIAASADVSKRTVYNHFPSKEELFAEILLQLWQRSLARRDLPYRADLSLREQLLALVAQKLDMLDDDNFLDLARVAIAETIHTPERAQAMVAKMGEREEGLTTWLRAAQADGRLMPHDPAFATHQLYGLLKAFAFWPQVTMGQPRPSAEARQHIMTTTVDMFLGYYAQPSPTGT
ncbi:TetR family transcriptional regulator [Chitinimonas prasina]|uniref:TetR family transcriptional regulator n=1 Tax=Chitinimonas prasina TaxID=1434937 RepID=A0ABQ5YGN1_9NEIS|nr:TetR/AcrR family transcriptional regulator [Chitinimonas prasina]GLR14162.1 TetR family transcriptional regulator [Chitinimonas prasina]